MLVTRDMGLFFVGDILTTHFRVELLIDGKPVVMDVDTGAAVSLLSEQVFHSLPDATLHPS